MTFEHRGVFLRLHGKRWRFKWQGSWQSFDSLESAIQRLDELLDGRDKQRMIQAVHGGASRTVLEMIELWWEWKVQRLEKGTMRNYRIHIDQHIAPRIGALDAALVEPHTLQDDFYDTLDGIRTALIAHTILNQAFKWAILRKQIRRIDNPCAIARPDRKLFVMKGGPIRTQSSAVPEEEIPTPSEVEVMVLDALRRSEQKWLLFLNVMATYGMRPGEGCALQREDLHFDRRLIHIWKTADKNGREIKERPKSHYSHRYLPMTPSFIALIEPFLPSNGWLFPAERSDAKLPCWTSDTAARKFRRMRRRLGLPEHYHPHSLRHFVATRLLVAGKTDVQVARFLGHRDASEIRERYGNHVQRDAQVDISEAAADLFRRPRLELSLTAPWEDDDFDWDFE